VVNVLVLWTIQYTDLSLAQGHLIKEQDLARLSRLNYKHIYLLGRYHLALADVVARGEFRPVRDGEESKDDEDYAAWELSVRFRSVDCHSYQYAKPSWSGKATRRWQRPGLL
jgi:hypothetical protein